MATNPSYDEERQAYYDALTHEDRERVAGYEALAADGEQEEECIEWCEERGTSYRLPPEHVTREGQL